MVKYERWAAECDYERRRKGIKWSDVAKMIGYSRAKVSATLCGSERASPNVKKALCEYFGVSLI